jgi:LSD1 subclass zinc finger protein
MMQQIRCPRCNRLLGYFEGSGVVQCSRCRKGVEVEFDTKKKIIKIKSVLERH